MKNQWRFICTVMAGMAMTATASASDFPAFSQPRAITSGPKEHLFASYYAINAWSADGRYATVLQTDVRDRLATENDIAVLGVVDSLQNNTFIPLTETRCWNFQEATMAHWIGPRQFVFNDLVDGKFAAVVYDMDTKTRRVAGPPVSAVSPDGKWALSINYARLRVTRTDYGYGGSGQDARLDTVWPEDDGLWLVNLATGEAKLLISIASMRDRMPRIKDPNGLAYFCHTVFSRDGSKIFWLARTVEGVAAAQKKGTRAKGGTAAFFCNFDGSDARRCFPDGWSGSHYNWLDGDRMQVSALYQGKFWSHVFFTAGKDDYTRLGSGLLDFDGHGVFSDDGKWMATDTYPDKNLWERRLMVLRMSDQAVLPLGSFFVPETYRGSYWRCDLHPRWRPDGKLLGFNSTHEGSRQVYVMDVE